MDYMSMDDDFIPSMMAFSDNMRTKTNEAKKFNISYQQKIFYLKELLFLVIG